MSETTVTVSDQDVCDVPQCWCKQPTWEQPLRAMRWSAAKVPHPFPRFPPVDSRSQRTG